MSDLIKFVAGGISIIVLLVVGFLGLGQIFKPLSVGTMTTQGTLLAVERNLLTDCIKVSQTTIGESVVISKCVYYKLPDLNLGDSVKFTYVVSPLLFKDRIDFVSGGN